MLIISAQYGDPRSCKVLRPFHKALTMLCKRHLLNRYFKTINELSIIWRVTGEIWKFGDYQGPEKLRYSQKGKYITVDLVIGENQWKNRSIEEIKSFIVNGMCDCFQLLIKRAEKSSELLDKELLQKDFDKVITDFKGMDIFL